MPDPSTPILPPATPVAHYRLEREVGSGAMGTVYLALDTALDRRVAVKVLRSEIAGREDLVERFFREARAAARVNHPNLTHIYFVGESGALRFFAMEYVEGGNLEEQVAAHGPLPFARAVDVLVQAARGLAAAHAAGVVHRDVKPSNLLLAPDGTVKVTDFGLAKSLEGSPSATAAGAVVGTPQYMSPEQCRGQEATPRSDVYGLGLVAWYLLAGRAPFDAGAVGQVLHDQIAAPLPPLPAACADVPEGMGRLLRRMTAKDPAERPASMGEVAALLEELRPRPLLLAPFVVRAGAAGLDFLVVLVAGSVLGALAVLLLHGRGALASEAGAERASVLFSIVVSAASWGLQFGLEAWQGWSPGKLAFRLAAVRADGGRPTLPQHVLRHLLRWPGLAVVPMGLGVLEVLGLLLQAAAVVAGVAGYAVLRGRTLSDVLTRTRVVMRLRSERPEAPAGP